MTPDEFRVAGHRLVDWIADYVETVEQRPVTPGVQPGDVMAQLPDHPPCGPEPFDAVLADVDRIVVPGIVHWQHPSFFAYFPANSSYATILAELLSAGLGVNGMSWVTSPACTELELRTLDWMAELLDLPERFRNTSESGGGVIQGTASEATLVAVLSAALAGDRRRRQRRRRHVPARRLRHCAGPLEHREGVAHRRRRDEIDPCRRS